MISADVREHLRKLSHEIRGEHLHCHAELQLVTLHCWCMKSHGLYAELDVGYEVPAVHVDDLTPLSFYRDYVSRNKPVLIRGKNANCDECSAPDAALKTPQAQVVPCSLTQSSMSQYVYTGALEGWPALQKWNSAGLQRAMGSSLVSM